MNGEAYNIGTGKGTTVMDIAKTMQNIIAPQKEIRIRGGQAWDGDMTHAIADISKSVSQLGFKPKTNLKEGIQQYIEWLEQINC